MRVARYALLLVSINLSCAKTTVVPERQVDLRAVTGADVTAAAILHDSTVCELTIRDPAGQLFDRRAVGDQLELIDMTRRTHYPRWEVHNSRHPSRLLSALLVPPGNYEIVQYATSNDWKELPWPTYSPLTAQTDCSGRLDIHPVSIPFRVDAGELTLLALPEGALDFAALRHVDSALRQSRVEAALGPIFPKVRLLTKARYDELVAEQRQERDGYDLYPSCNGSVAVVRSSGIPLPWSNATFRRKLYLPVRSQHASGWGGGCVEGLALKVFIASRADVDQAVELAGKWLVTNDFAGEVDIEVMSVPVEL